MFEDAKKAIPLGRFATAEDVSNAVCFFASDLSAYRTGTTLYVDGAQHLNYEMGLARVMKYFKPKLIDGSKEKKQLKEGNFINQK